LELAFRNGSHRNRPSSTEHLQASTCLDALQNLCAQSLQLKGRSLFQNHGAGGQVHQSPPLDPTQWAPDDPVEEKDPPDRVHLWEMGDVLGNHLLQKDLDSLYDFLNTSIHKNFSNFLNKEVNVSLTKWYNNYPPPINT